MLFKVKILINKIRKKEEIKSLFLILPFSTVRLKGLKGVDKLLSAKVRLYI